MNQEEAFIHAIQEQPEDEAVRLVYADWLEERSDPRSEYLRLRHQLMQARRRMSVLQSEIAPAWLASIGERLRVVLLSFVRDRQMDVIIRLKAVIGLSIPEAKKLVDGPGIAFEGRCVVKRGLTPEEAKDVADHLSRYANVVIEPDVE